MCFFSIIIPTYNSAATIKQCVETVLGQTFKSFEVLIIDGVSKDDTLEICNSFEDHRIKVRSEVDKGIYDAMNKGVKHANGKWLYFLGSDDFMYNNEVFDKIYAEIEKKECDLVYGNAWFRKAQYVHDGEFTRLKLVEEKNICHQVVFYKKELFNKLGLYNLEFHIWADWDFNIRCFSLPSIKPHFVDIIVCDYNDIGGKSSIPGIDKDFANYLKLPYLQRDKYWKMFKQESIEFKIGSLIMLPYKIISWRIRALFRRIKDEKSI